MDTELDPIESVEWYLTVCTEQGTADIFTVDERFVAEGWDRYEAREYVDDHNEKLALVARVQS